MRSFALVGIWAALSWGTVACSGGQQGSSQHPIGDTHEAKDDLDSDDKDPGGTSDAVASNGDGTMTGDGDGDSGDGDSGDGDGTPAKPVDPNAPLVTFELKNTGSTELTFAIEKGWGMVISGFSGVAGSGAKAIEMFPRHCSVACGADAVCPVCEEFKKAKDERAAEQHITVAPGESKTVAWDGTVYRHGAKKRHGGSKTKCNCYDTEKVPPETYTLRACGLRVTKSAKKRSKYQCPILEGVTLPPDTPTTVTFEFPDEDKKKDKKGR